MYKKILTIQDISCVGQCSITVALPILSSLGHETAILPTAILSTHTSGFKDFTFRDLADDIPKVVSHWEKENITFDAIYTGYLGSIEEITYVRDIFKTFGNNKAIKIVDPAMGDNGILYPSFDETYAKEMLKLAKDSDILVPNITEACFLTGIEYREKYDEKYIDSILLSLKDLGINKVVLTGVSYKDDTTGIVVFENGYKEYYSHQKIDRMCHGTGDVYASTFVGCLLNDMRLIDAAKIAADFTVKCILNTYDDKEHWYGVKFEPLLSNLTKLVK